MDRNNESSAFHLQLRITAVCGDGVVHLFSPTVDSFPSSSPVDPSFTLHFINSQKNVSSLSARKGKAMERV